MDNMDKVRVGLIGVGNIGTAAYLKNITSGEVPGMEITAVCDIDPERRKFVADNYEGIKIFEDYHDLLECGIIDLVVVAVPHYSHPTIAIDAFEKGLNVLVEKPAGVYTKQVLEMNEAAKKSGKFFGIMYNQRTNPVYKKLRQLIKEGHLGNIKRVNWTVTDWYRPQGYHDSGTWRSTWKDEGGGALINQNPHQLDLWQWLFGMPTRIMAHVYFGKYYNIEVEDDVTAFMEYDNGMTGTYITSTGEAPGTNRLEIACDMGRVVVENNELKFDRNVVSEREYNANHKGVFGHPECWKVQVPIDGEVPGEQHVGILKNIVDVLTKGAEPIAYGYEGINGLTISNAMHYSAWTGKWADINDFPHEEFYEILQGKIKDSKIIKSNRKVVADTKNTY